MRWRADVVITALLVVVPIMPVPPALADVVELRSGQRVEGTFRMG